MIKKEKKEEEGKGLWHLLGSYTNIPCRWPSYENVRYARGQKRIFLKIISKISKKISEVLKKFQKLSPLENFLNFSSKFKS